MGNEKKAWFLLFCFILLISIPICFINIYLDCANQLQIFHGDVAEVNIAKATVNGETVYFPKHPNERLCKEELIKVLPEHCDTVAIGSSLLMTLNQNILGLKDGEFYNLGVSGANLKDYLNTLGIMKPYGKEADTYIFLLHIDVFLPNTDSRHEFLDSYGNKYIEYLDGKENFIKEKDNLMQFKSIFETVFSISYFRDNLKFFSSHGKVIENYIVGGDHPEYAHYFSDGSWGYDIKYSQKTIEDIYDDIKKNGTKFMHAGQHVVDENFHVFDKIITNLLNHNKKIILYYSPYCPSLYKAYPPQNSPCLREIEKFIYKYDNTENIKIFGSFYPEVLGVTDEDYYDARHIRREMLQSAFRPVSN